jgi:hypothetical protein
MLFLRSLAIGYPAPCFATSQLACLHGSRHLARCVDGFSADPPRSGRPHPPDALVKAQPGYEFTYVVPDSYFPK